MAGVIDGGIPGMVRVINQSPGPIDITLTDGDNLYLRPFQMGASGHISKWVSSLVIPKSTKEMALRGTVRIEGGK